MSSSGFARTPAPPYYAVVFTAQRTAAEPDEYAATAERMLELAAQQPGFLGAESARDADGLGITVSYWTDEAAIHAWKQQLDHRAARQQGRAAWYAQYALRVARVERAYDWSRGDAP